MPTFKHTIPYFKSDGTARVIIRLTHKRETKPIRTDIYVTKDDLTRSGNVKSEYIRGKIEDILKQYRRTIMDLGLKVNAMSIDEIISILSVSKAEGIDFIEFGRGVAEKLKKKGDTGNGSNILTALNSLIRFAGDEHFPINNLTAKFLTEYESWLRVVPSKNSDSPVKGRAISLYTGIFRKLINMAKAEFNDEDHRILKVTVSPFSKYKVPVDQATKKRALSIELIKRIRDLDIGEKDIRMNLARDSFILSFYLVGMNAADLFTCTDIKKGIITYNRKKTASRRKDKAEIQIRVEPEANALFEKYRDQSGSRIFKFYKMYSSSNNFNSALNKGLKQVGAALGIPNLTFYAARHSWATIAVNDCGIDKYLVHEALNHVDETMRVTDIYVARDFSRIWEANKTMISYLQKL
ncbi:MAG: transposase [Bacteroidetes bacterium HGW-Bacteroidetes-11]|nr:MAG: transposase [Bacteroidetes bacterium HGW-Bacteroidetes-11]